MNTLKKFTHTHKHTQKFTHTHKHTQKFTHTQIQSAHILKHTLSMLYIRIQTHKQRFNFYMFITQLSDMHCTHKYTITLVHTVFETPHIHTQINIHTNTQNDTITSEHTVFETPHIHTHT